MTTTLSLFGRPILISDSKSINSTILQHAAITWRIFSIEVRPWTNFFPVIFFATMLALDSWLCNEFCAVLWFKIFEHESCSTINVWNKKHHCSLQYIIVIKTWLGNYLQRTLGPFLYPCIQFCMDGPDCFDWLCFCCPLLAIGFATADFISRIRESKTDSEPKVKWALPVSNAQLLH